MSRIPQKLELSTAALSALQSVTVRQEVGTAVLIFPSTATTNVVREVQDFLKRAHRSEATALRKVGKLLEINKFTCRTTRAKGIVIAISQKAPDWNTKAKLVPLEGDWAPDYEGNLDVRIRPS